MRPAPRPPAALTTLTTLVMAAALAALPACGGGSDRSITVLAASSLTEAFTDVAAAFERAHPDVDVRVSFGASSALAAQAHEGVPADVFAAADEQAMRIVTRAGDARDPVVFARNHLALAVARGNPQGVDALADLARAGFVVVLCDPTVPCGRLADRALRAAGVEVDAASREVNVKATLARVELGEADAAIVYATDVRAGEDVEAVDVPELRAAVTRYPIAVLEQTERAADAAAFVDFVVSPDGRSILTRHGFLAP